MRTGALRKMRRVFGRVLRGNDANSVDVVLHERAVTNGADYDPYIMASEADAGVTTEKRTVRALAHHLTQEEVVRRGFVNLLGGDIILDFRHDEELGGNATVFEVAGRLYTRKEAGDDLAGDFTDTYLEGAAPFLTVVVTPVGG